MELTLIKILCIFVILQINLLEVESQDFLCRQTLEAFGTQCYQFVHTAMNWRDAQDFCRRNGGYLASVTSSDENKFIFVQGRISKGGHYWLGGMDSVNEGTWKWDSGDPWIFTAWGENEPNNRGHGGQNCLLISSNSQYTWDYYNCDYLITFVCEVPSIQFSKNRTTTLSATTTALTTEHNPNETETNIRTYINGTDVHVLSTRVMDRICISVLTVILLVTAFFILQRVPVALFLLLKMRGKYKDIAGTGVNGFEDQTNIAMVYFTAPSDQDKQ